MGGQRITLAIVQDRVKKLHGKRLRVLSFKSNSAPLKVECTKHSEVFTLSQVRFVFRTEVGCARCSIEKRSAARSVNWLSGHKKRVERFKGKLQFVGPYKGSKVETTYKCHVHGKIQAKPEYVDTWKHHCPKCEDGQQGTTKSLGAEKHAKRMLRRHGDHIRIIGKYVNNRTPIEYQCKVHRVSFNMRPEVMERSSYPCPSCLAEHRAAGQGQRHTDAEFRKKLRQVTKTVKPLQEYKGALSKIKCRCTVCRNTWNTIPFTLLKGHGCPFCNRADNNYETGIYTSPKSKVGLSYRSGWERIAYEILDADKSVKKIEAEPLFIEYANGAGRVRKYFPDIRVTYRDGKQELIEVKPACQLDDPVNRRKFKAARSYCRANGLTFSVWTEKELNQ